MRKFISSRGAVVLILTRANILPEIILIFVLLISGCVYPIYKTLQPGSVVTVKDTAGSPVQDATVTMMSISKPSGIRTLRDTQVTNAQGQAIFDRRSEWRAEAMMMHGSEEFSWDVCVEKQGYLTASSANGLTVTLEHGVSSPCPQSY